MSETIVYYHDPVEVNPKTSWTGLATTLKEAKLERIAATADQPVVELFRYAQPDAVVVVNGQPMLSIEQTQMNPSGHNIPQRFSCLVRAAELGVPSIIYYPEFSRRTFSDPNVRYLQVRVPLAQRRLSTIFDVPALSIFWPTDKATLLPDVRQEAHRGMAAVVDALVSHGTNPEVLSQLPEVQRALTRMDGAVDRYAQRYRQNPSVRQLLPNGFAAACTRKGINIDPPHVASLVRTERLLASLGGVVTSVCGRTAEARLRSRELSLVLAGTANKAGIDSEHPWPGYLTLLDILYLRVGRSSSERICNLVYSLPVPLKVFEARVNREDAPTAAYIVDHFADLIVLDGGIMIGQPIRNAIPSEWH